MERAHDRMNDNQRIQPPGSIQRKIDPYINGDPQNSDDEVGSHFVKPGPFRQIFSEFRVYICCVMENARIRISGPPHHLKQIRIIFGGVGIEFSVGISVMHAVHDAVSSWTEIRGALEEKGKDVEKFFPTFLHRKHPVCGITMMKKCLCKQREIPMSTQYSQYPHKPDFYGK